jgi:hypothetical protein
MVDLGVINWPMGVATNYNVIIKIHKYRRLHEVHRFILMAVQVHNAPKHDMDRFIKECARLFHDRWSKDQLYLFFLI